jgi:hypothetical protein
MDQPSNAAADEPLSDAAPKGRDQVYLPCPAGQAARTPPLPGVSSTGWREAGGNVFWLSSRCFYCICDGRLAVVCETNLSKVSTRRRSFGGSPWWAKSRPT